MCLYIPKIKTPVRFRREEVQAPDGPQKLVPVWKIITKSNDSLMLAGAKNAPKHSWTKGWNQSSKQHKYQPYVHHGNRYTHTCRSGFHFILRKKDAKTYGYTFSQINMKTSKIVKMYVDPKDVIAIGKHGVFVFEMPHIEVNGLVATKAFWKGE